MPPPVPVRVIVYFPLAVVDAILTVMVAVPAPGAGMVLGLNVTVAPGGWPEALSEMGALKPPNTAVVTVIMAEDPGGTLTDLADGVIENVGVATLSKTLVVWTLPPPVPLTVRVY